MVLTCLDSWDGLALFLTRLLLVGSCGYGTGYYGRRALTRTQNLGIIPRWLYAFTAGWMAYITVVVTWYVLSCHASLTWLERTMYGQALGWIIIGQLVMAVRGTRQVESAVAVGRQYEDKVKGEGGT